MDMQIGGDFYKGRYLFTVDYKTAISDDPAQHKQSHVLQLIDADKWTQHGITNNGLCY